jgi:GTP-binding protein
VIDALSDNPTADFEIISQELEAYDLGILEKPQILAFSRIDLLTDKEKNELAKTGELIIKKHKNIFKYDKKPYLFSSVTHLGLEELIREVDAELSKIPKETKMEVKTFTIADVAAAPNVVEKIDNKFVVTGPKLEKFAQKTDFSNEYAVLRLYDIMKKTGIIKQIEKKGGRFGDKIEIIGREIDYRG